MIQSSLFSFAPKVWREDQVLCARTHLLGIVARLGLYWTNFRADPPRRSFEVTRHYLWFFTSHRVIPFAQVRDIVYKYDDPFSFTGYIDHARNATDRYTIGLNLYDEDEILLLSWLGEGEFSNESYLPDIFYWSDFTFDVVGTQKKESLAFYESLCAMIRPRNKLHRD